MREFSWTIDTHDRSAGEYPTQLKQFPVLAQVNEANSQSTLYEHEKGNDDDGNPLEWTLTSPFFDSGRETVNIIGLIPDSNQTGNVTATINVKKYPQSSSLYDNIDVTVTPTTEIISIRKNSRFIQYSLTGNTLNQSWRSGRWLQAILRGGNR